MKLTLLTLLLIPLLSFGQNTDQLSKKDKKKIDKYTISMCECVSEYINSLHPKTVEVVLLIAEKGSEDAMKDIEAMLEAMDGDEIEEFLAAFSAMETQEFQDKMDVCDRTDDLGDVIGDEINNEEGNAYDYFMEFITKEDTCKVLKALYDIGASSEE